MAKTRGSDQITKVFLRALSDEALFDDRGAWYENNRGVSNGALIGKIGAEHGSCQIQLPVVCFRLVQE
jgi:hypothetical protein